MPLGRPDLYDQLTAMNPGQTRQLRRLREQGTQRPQSQSAMLMPPPQQSRGQAQQSALMAALGNVDQLTEAFRNAPNIRREPQQNVFGGAIRNPRAEPDRVHHIPPQRIPGAPGFMYYSDPMRLSGERTFGDDSAPRLQSPGGASSEPSPERSALIAALRMLPDQQRNQMLAERFDKSHGLEQQKFDLERQKFEDLSNDDASRRRAYGKYIAAVQNAGGVEELRTQGLTFDDFLAQEGIGTEGRSPGISLFQQPSLREILGEGFSKGQLPEADELYKRLEQPNKSIRRKLTEEDLAKIKEVLDQQPEEYFDPPQGIIEILTEGNAARVRGRALWYMSRRGMSPSEALKAAKRDARPLKQANPPGSFGRTPRPGVK